MITNRIKWYQNMWMRSDLFVNYSLVLDILCVTYFLTSITMPDTQTSDMR